MADKHGASWFDRDRQLERPARAGRGIEIGACTSCMVGNHADGPGSRVRERPNAMNLPL